MEIQGKIIMKLPLQEGTSKAGNPWKKQEYVLETFGNYPRKVKFDFFGERVDQYQLNEGEDVTISFDLESREFNGRWYTDVRAFSCQKGVAPAAPAAPSPAAPVAPAAAAQPAVTAPQPLQPSAPANFEDEGENADLPF